MADECVTREFDSACISSNVSIQLQYHVVRHVVCLTDGLSSAPVDRKRKIPNGCSLTSCQRTGNFSLSQTRYIYLDLLSHLLKSSHHTALVKTLNKCVSKTHICNTGLQNYVPHPALFSKGNISVAHCMPLSILDSRLPR